MKATTKTQRISIESNKRIFTKLEKEQTEKAKSLH
jgi:hypothetical protein